VARQLAQLETAGQAEVWFDRDLEMGESWEGRIMDVVQRADVVLLLVSPAYLASSFVSNSELPAIAERGRQGARVVPVVIAPCNWQQHPYIGSLQAFQQGHELRAPTTITFGRQAAELVKQLSQLLDAPPAATPEPAPPTEPSRRAPPTALALPDADSAPSALRTDEAGLAFKGSQLQTQLYVNAKTTDLTEAVSQALSIPEDASLEWRSPLATDDFREYRDKAFLQAVGCGQLAAALKDFWPGGGPRWDALAKVNMASGGIGVLLAEGKSYPEEMAGGGCKAAGESRERIGAAMRTTQEALGMQPDPERWLGRYYQFANRLAYTVWLRSQGVEAWLVHLLFTDDPHGPTDSSTWQGAVDSLHAELGLDEEQLENVGVVMLPALERGLLAPVG